MVAERWTPAHQRRRKRLEVLAEEARAALILRKPNHETAETGSRLSLQHLVGPDLRPSSTQLAPAVSKRLLAAGLQVGSFISTGVKGMLLLASGWW